MRFRRPRAFSTAGARRQARYRRRANSTDPSRSRRSVLHLVRELRGICSNRSAVAWGAPLIRWSDDGAIVLAARPIASLIVILRTQPDCIRWCRRARNCQGQAPWVVAEEATSLDSSCARRLAAVAGRDEETGFEIEQRK